MFDVQKIDVRDVETIGEMLDLFTSQFHKLRDHIMLAFLMSGLALWFVTFRVRCYWKWRSVFFQFHWASVGKRGSLGLDAPIALKSGIFSWVPGRRRPCSSASAYPSPPNASSRTMRNESSVLVPKKIIFLISRAYIGLQCTRRSTGKQMAKFIEIFIFVEFIICELPGSWRGLANGPH